MPSANALLGRFYHVKSKGTVDQFDTLGRNEISDVQIIVRSQQVRSMI
jgi:hypothetical protein